MVLHFWWCNNFWVYCWSFLCIQWQNDKKRNIKSYSGNCRENSNCIKETAEKTQTVIKETAEKTQSILNEIDRRHTKLLEKIIELITDTKT